VPRRHISSECAAASAARFDVASQPAPVSDIGTCPEAAQAGSEIEHAEPEQDDGDDHGALQGIVAHPAQNEQAADQAEDKGVADPRSVSFIPRATTRRRRFASPQDEQPDGR